MTKKKCKIIWVYYVCYSTSVVYLAYINIINLLNIRLSEKYEHIIHLIALKSIERNLHVFKNDFICINIKPCYCNFQNPIITYGTRLKTLL